MNGGTEVEDRLGIAVLGSTGSVGSAVLTVARAHPERLEVVALAAFGSDPEALLAQVEEFRPELVAVCDETAGREMAAALPSGVDLATGSEAACEAATHPRVERVVAAVVGAAGMEPVAAALDSGRDVALANKESLVIAGSLLSELAAARGCRIIPVDSEHAALHQTLDGRDRGEISRLCLTASGGPFRERSPDTFEDITPEEALSHPTWSMGDKITVDSATLMNKGFEIIEAVHLFDVEPERVEVVVHPQSLVHSLVEFRDGTWLAQLSPNDMVFPVQHALSHPSRWGNEFPRLEPSALGALDFEPVDRDRFPAIDLARRALAMGESAPAVLNAANEVAVERFLAGELRFPEISELVEQVLRDHEATVVASVEDAREWDRWGRERAVEILA